MILTIEQMMPRDELIRRIDSLEDFVYDKVKDYGCAFDSIDGKIEELYNLTGKFENCVNYDEYYDLKQRIINLEAMTEKFENCVDPDEGYMLDVLKERIIALESMTVRKYQLDNAISRISNMERKIIDLENKMRRAGF